MKTLYILRSAESIDLDNSLSDFERRINLNGALQAISIGEEIFRKRITVDRIYCSAAKRARQTAVIVKELGELDAPVMYKECLYGSSPLKYKEKCFEMLAGCDSILLVGHHPDLEILAKTLTGLPITFDNGMVLKIQLNISRWEDSFISTEIALIDLIICPQDCSIEKAANRK